MSPKETPEEHEDHLVDEALEETFPASDSTAPMRKSHEDGPAED